MNLSLHIIIIDWILIGCLAFLLCLLFGKRKKLSDFKDLFLEERIFQDSLMFIMFSIISIVAFFSVLFNEKKGKMHIGGN